jgi:hypothetical protein
MEAKLREGSDTDSLRSVRVYVNALRSSALEEALAGDDPDGDSILRFLCDPDVDSSPVGFAARYREISVGCEAALFIAPIEEKVFSKLVLPLRHAKASFVAGNYLATISLAGMVAEMCALFEFELAEVRVGKEVLDTEAQARIFGSTFEKLGQDRRVKVLLAFGLVGEEAEKAFEQIRLIRKKYLHLWSQDTSSMRGDAVECFRSATKLVDKVLGFDVKDGNIIFHPRVVRYLEAKGAFVKATSRTE